MRAIIKILSLLRKKLALTPEQADQIRFPCC